MTLKKITALTFLFALLFVFTIDAQNLDWNITGAGARAAGFGGAFIGVADDATAVVWNPAGLTSLMRPEASLVSRFVSDKYEFKLGNRTESESQSHFVLNFLSGAYPLMDGRLVIATAFQRQLDFYYYDEDDEGKYEQTGGADTFTPGIGFRFVPFFSAGLSSNIWLGDAEYKYTDKEDSFNDFEEDYSFSGFNFVFGALVDFSYLKNPIPIKVGASVRTPFDLEWKSSFSYSEATTTFTIEMPLMLGFGASCRIGENLTLAADYEIRAYGDSKLKIDDLDLEFPLSESQDDLNQLRVGAEYLIISDFAVIPIRAGFQTVPTIYANYDDSDNVEDQVIGSGFSVGSGLIFEKFALDVTFSTTGYEQKWGSLETDKISSNIITLSGIVYF